MPIARIRGEQIKLGVIGNPHIDANNPIEESKLSINWNSHTEALQNKKVVDYIQVNDTSVAAGASEVDVSTIIGSRPTTASDPLSGEGVIVDAPKNKCIIRDGVTNEPITTVINSVAYEVFGRLTYDSVNSKFILKFFTASGAGGAEEPYTFASAATIDWQFAQRFNLLTVDELFAANEKFVEGAADASAHLNISQLAHDLYGASYNLDASGLPKLSKPVTQQIADEVSRAQTAEADLQSQINTEITNRTNAISDLQTQLNNEIAARQSADNNLQNLINTETSGVNNPAVKAKNIIDEVVTARGANTTLSDRLAAIETTAQNDVSQLKSDLASTAVGKGASMVGIEDAGAKFASSTVEGALSELFDKVNTDVANEASARQAADSALDGRVTALENEVTTARGSLASIDARLDVALNENGTLKEGTKIHVHKKAVVTPVVGQTRVDMPANEYFQNDGTLDVYVNGLLQAPGVNYTEVYDAQGRGIAVDFAPDTFVDGDVVILKWVVNNQA
ncbi:hypothetical protein MTAT_04710 [Moorella thermoacetica]|uniref:Uncharacterized protein n=1 Tax=Neomoorella thermoacetica TaxID=1525 RepID=A0AAC9HIW6_NEOTH|nr:hypothetical protein [Moorella thermoacetica]AOQ24730.1 hypothetical protein Maut_02302 [Moorella thermoacetica]TYL15732.1 hypothetical protein MTAT_04710 [Moorella thermoacetica]